MAILNSYKLEDLRRLEWRIENSITPDQIADLCIGFCKRNNLTLDELFRMQALGGGPDLEAKFEMAFGAHGILEEHALDGHINTFDRQEYRARMGLEHPAAEAYQNRVAPLIPDPDMPPPAPVKKPKP